MRYTKQDAVVADSKTYFNYNKLQAVACIASSAAVSIALIYWTIRSLV